MKTPNCQFLHPLQRDGTSRNQRLLKALQPSFVPIDDRSLGEMLVYAKKYAHLLRYYTVENTPSGNWADFIRHDASTIIALILNTDPKPLKDRFEKKLSLVETRADTSAFAQLFQIFFTLAGKVDQWHRDSPEGLSVHTDLDRYIKSVLNHAVKEMLAYALGAEESGITIEIPDVKDFSSAWEGLSSVNSKKVFSSPPAANELAAALGPINRHFNALYTCLVHLSKKAPAYLGETLEQYPDHQPHMALLLAFLQLFEYARTHLNSLSVEHLKFYYEAVLQLKPRAEQPDQVHLVFELAKQADQFRLKKGTLFKAGKDVNGNNLFYANDEEWIINRAGLDRTHGLKTLFVDKKDSKIRGIYAAPIANSIDGRGGDIENEEGKWETFGSASMPEADIGFAVASPMLLLAEGTRNIFLKFIFEASPLLAYGSGPKSEYGYHEEKLKEKLEKSLGVFLSGEKAWQEVLLEDVTVHFPKPKPFTPGSRGSGLWYTAGSRGINFPGKPTQEPSGEKEENPYIEFHVKLDPEAPPVVAYDEKVHQNSFNTVHPVVKFLLHPRDGAYPFEDLKKLRLQALKIKTEVSGLKTLILENDLGVLNPAKPFHPFGPVPKKGSRFYIGSSEVFQKSLESLTLDVTWGDLPEENFSDHYDEYKENRRDNVKDNHHFRLILEQLHGGSWVVPSDTLKEKGVPAGINLFEPETDKPNDKPSATRQFTYTHTFERPERITGFDHFSMNLQYGFLRMTLLNSFLHGLYPKILAAAVSSGADVPNTPYTPLITELSLNYTAVQTIDYQNLDTKDFKSRIEQLFHITPFGQVEIFPIEDKTDSTRIFINRSLVPDFKAGGDSGPTAEGSLYIGIENLDPPQALSILFQVAEGSADPKTEPPKVNWSYMADNQWNAFEKSDITMDKTNGLLTSGIIRFAVPKAITCKNTVLPKDIYWLKADVENKSGGIAKLIAVMPQAVSANFYNQNNDLSHLASALPAETISKAQKRAASVKKITQPFASLGGRLPEKDDAFYIRVSERLRHKNRAVTIFDYERLVLEAFPELYKVKCINHTREKDEFSPGHVRLVVVPDLRNKNAVDPFKPSASVNTLKKINTYVSGLASDFVTVDVSPPVYEEIKVDFKVAFRPGYDDQGFYLKQLEASIIRFLSPWLYDDVADLSFGGRINRSWILNHVENREYVDFVTDFRMDHYVPRQGPGATGPPAMLEHKDVEEAVAQSSSSVLVSAPAHKIRPAKQPSGNGPSDQTKT